MTSFTELRRDGMAAERARLGGQAKSWVETCLDGTDGPVIAASDYVRAVPDLFGVGKSPYTVLGTDGFGRSDTRAALRAFFEVDARHIAIAALSAIDASLVRLGSAAVRARPRGAAPLSGKRLFGRFLSVAVGGGNTSVRSSAIFWR